jgi:hypothetical protein
MQRYRQFFSWLWYYSLEFGFYKYFSACSATITPQSYSFVNTERPTLRTCFNGNHFEGIHTIDIIFRGIIYNKYIPNRKTTHTHRKYESFSESIVHIKPEKSIYKSKKEKKKFSIF